MEMYKEMEGKDGGSEEVKCEAQWREKCEGKQKVLSARKGEKWGEIEVNKEDESYIKCE